MRPIGGQRIEYIRRRDDPRFEGDLIALKSARIAVAVKTLMMRRGNGSKTPKSGDARQDRLRVRRRRPMAAGKTELLFFVRVQTTTFGLTLRLAACRI
jgi:hypothetical protein